MPRQDPAERLAPWLAASYPEFPHAYPGRSGATLLLDAFRSEPRRTVVLPAFTCGSLSAAAVRAGKQVLHVDVQRDTLHMDPVLLDRSLSRLDPADTLLVVDHTFGRPFAGIARLRERFPGLLIVEDCVRALGSRVDGRPVGREGDWCLLSLYKTTPGNNHGAVLLTRTPYALRSGPAPAVTLKQRVCGSRAVRALYERLRGADFNPSPTDREAPRWEEAVGLPNRLCLTRFLEEIGRLDDRIARQQAAAARLRDRLGDIPGLRLLPPVPGEAAHFLTFLVEGGVSRDALLTGLHRRGFFLERTWNLVPSSFRSLAHTFRCGSTESAYLAGHIGHLFVRDFLDVRQQDGFLRACLSLLGTHFDSTRARDTALPRAPRAISD